MEALFHRVIGEQRLVNERYIPQSFLGQGGMGWVISAEDSFLPGESVVLKFLYPHHIQNPQALSRFKNEVLLSRRLIHPNIVRTHNFTTDSVLGHNIVMEHVTGRTLRQQLLSQQSPTIPLQEALTIFVQVLRSIQYAHRIGIVHLDLKPENVLCTANGQIKLADFGLAQMLRTSEQGSRTLLGTPRYMAPEQFHGELFDERTDIYSLGIVGYELLTGVCPYDGETVYALAEQHCETPLPSIRDRCPAVPIWIEEVVQR